MRCVPATFPKRKSPNAHDKNFPAQNSFRRRASESAPRQSASPEKENAGADAPPQETDRTPEIRAANPNPPTGSAPAPAPKQASTPTRKVRSDSASEKRSRAAPPMQCAPHSQRNATKAFGSRATTSNLRNLRAHAKARGKNLRRIRRRQNARRNAATSTRGNAKAAPTSKKPPPQKRRNGNPEEKRSRGRLSETSASPQGSPFCPKNATQKHPAQHAPASKKNVPAETQSSAGTGKSAFSYRAEVVEFPA